MEKSGPTRKLQRCHQSSQQNGILLSREVILLSNTQRGSVMDS